MFLTTFIKDYIDSLGDLQYVLQNRENFAQLIPLTAGFVVSGVKMVLVYLFTFQWLRDLVYLPVVLPNLVDQAINERLIIGGSPNLLEFSSFLTTKENLFTTGLLNSFFYSLPISVSSFIILRRATLGTKESYLSSILGTALGRTTLLGAILFGMRWIIIPWAKFEPLPSLLGLILTVNIAHHFLSEKGLDKRQQPLIQYVGFSFLLSWTEQTVFFPYLSSFGSLESLFNVQSNLTSQNLLYLIGFFTGNIVFLTGFSLVAIQLKKLIQSILLVAEFNLERKLNYFFVISLLTASFATFPYYSIDYLATAPFGFLKNDQIILNARDYTKNQLLKDVFMQDQQLMQTASVSIDQDDSRLIEFSNYQTDKRENGKTPEDVLYKAQFDSVTRLQRQQESDKEGSEALRNVLTKFLPQQNSVSKAPKVNEEIVWNDEFDEPLSDSLRNNSFRQKYSDPKYLELPDETNTASGERSALEMLTLLQSFRDANIDPAVYNPTDEELIFKQRYYDNPVYQILLKSDINSFLSAQPKEYFLTSSEKEKIQTTRRALFAYANSLRKYQEMPNAEEFKSYLLGVKSYSNQIYNHQFNGTWTLIRRLFQVNPSTDFTNVVSYDQPLFATEKDRPNFNHEELDSESNKGTYTFQLQSMNPLPLYAGWDASTNRFVLTTRFLNFKEANTAFVPFEGLASKDFITNNNKVFFTSWPILSTEKDKSQNSSYRGLTLTDVTSELKKDVESKLLQQFNKEYSFSKDSFANLPINIQTAGSEEGNVILPPTFGGWLWPGKSATLIR